MKKIKLENWTVVFEWKDITDKPVLNYMTADWKEILRPTKMETRENWIEIADENEWLFGVYFHWELDCFIRWEKLARRYLQDLIDEEDYYNGNEKEYWELEF